MLPAEPGGTVDRPIGGNTDLYWRGLAQAKFQPRAMSKKSGSATGASGIALVDGNTKTPTTINR